VGDSPTNIEAYLEGMVRLLRGDGVRFPDNKQMKFSRLEPTYAGNADGIYAEGRWAPEGETDPQADGGPATVGVVIGPQYGPVTVKLIEDLIRPASRRYEDLVIAGFRFAAEAQALIDESPHPKLRIHVAHIRPDVNPGMNGLVKEAPGSQLFTVFGQPRTKLIGPDKGGEYKVEMEGVGIYDPVDNSVSPTRADKVAA
jgi:adenine-specific DNA-methyltransferase